MEPFNYSLPTQIVFGPGRYSETGTLCAAIGKKVLLHYGIDHWGVSELTVNKQNPQAIGFYQRMGFTTYKETSTDEEGRPYPLLYMKREG